MAFYRLGFLKRIWSNGRTAQSKKVLCQTTKRTFAFTSTFFRPNFLSTKLFETKINVNKDSDLSMELAKYAVNFLNSKQFISSEVYDRAKLFHTDAVLWGIAAISLKAKSPTILRESNLLYYSNFSQKPENTRVAKMFGLNKYTNIEKAVAANVSATHDLNSNGFSLGFANDDPTRTSLGEVSNNSYYPVVIAAAHVNSKIDGLKALKAMILLDEIRGRLNESFDINEYHVDNDLFGGIASTIVYGALLKATPEQISEAINLYIGNYTPWRAIKTGMYELADSAEWCPSFTWEMGITCMNRVLDNYQVENIQLPSHNLTLRTSGDKFSIMGMHFRFGCYSALSSGAIYSLINILLENPEIFEKYDYKDIVNIRVRTFSKAYEMAGKLPRSDAPVSRQAAIYSIQYLIGRMLSK